jgi:hypothetical protein
MLRQTASVAAALVLAGCTAHAVTPVAGPGAGTIATRVGTPGVVVAAPPGTSDPRTGQIADEVARRTGFGLVVAGGPEPDIAAAAPGRRDPVSRARDGLPGQPASPEAPGEGAGQVDGAYEQRVREAARGSLAFYTELHGNGRPEAAGRIEIATVGIDRDHALRLRTLFELIRDAHLRGRAGAPRLEVLIEPADRGLHGPSGPTREGAALHLSERALHIELPRAARAEWREVYTAILADFLAQAATLAPGR